MAWRITFEIRLQIRVTSLDLHIDSSKLIVVGIDVLENTPFCSQTQIVAARCCLPLEGTCGSWCSKVEVHFCVDLQCHPNHVLLH